MINTRRDSSKLFLFVYRTMIEQRNFSLGSKQAKKKKKKKKEQSKKWRDGSEHQPYPIRLENMSTTWEWWVDQIPRGRIPILTSRRAQMAKEMHLHFRNKHSKMALSCYKTRCSEEELPQLKNLGISFSTYYLLQIYKLTATTRELQPRGWWNLRHSLVSVLTFKLI